MAVVANIVTCGCGYVLWGEELARLQELLGTLPPLELARPPHEDEAAA
jgi:hypothetical protein